MKTIRGSKIPSSAEIPSHIGTRTSWYVESLILNRMDSWGVGFTVGAVALLLHDNLTARNLLLLVTMTVGYWLAYLVNDYFDWQIDGGKESWANLNFFTRHPEMRRPAGRLFLVLFGVVALGFLSFGWRGLLILLISYFVTWAYSAPPLALKSRAGFDLLAHAVFVQPWPYFVILFLTAARWGHYDFLLLTVNVVGSCSGQLNQQVRDFEADFTQRDTFAKRIGFRAAVRVLKLTAFLTILLFAGGLAVGLLPLAIAPLGLLALPELLKRTFGAATVRGFLAFRRIGYVSTLLAMVYVSVLLGLG